MPRVEVVPATLAHAEAMAGHLRPGDAREVEMVGRTQLEALAGGVRRSLWARTALVDGVPAAMWGITTAMLLGGLGHPWLLTTPLVERARKALLRVGFAEFAEMRAVFPCLSGHIDPEYRQAVRLVERLGCQVHSGGGGIGAFEVSA